MDAVQLKFTSMKNLWQFKESMQLTKLAIKTTEHTLSCKLSDAAIETAIRQFGTRQREQLLKIQSFFNH
jgi:hypothetical protein